MNPEPEAGRLWNYWATVHIEHGLTYGEAALWLNDTFFHGNPYHHAAIAASFRHAGFTIPEAITWRAHGIPPEPAARWATVGWHPAQVHALHRALRDTACPDKDNPEWRTSGVNPAWAIRYAAAGITPTEAARFESSRRAGAHFSGELDTLAALRGGGQPAAARRLGRA